MSNCDDYEPSGVGFNVDPSRYAYYLWDLTIGDSWFYGCSQVEVYLYSNCWESLNLLFKHTFLDQKAFKMKINLLLLSFLEDYFLVIFKTCSGILFLVSLRGD